MATEHTNISLLKRLDLGDLAGSAELFAPDLVFHYFNPRLPDFQGDYVGLTGLRELFDKLGNLSKGTFRIEPISLTAHGEELVVAHTQNRMVLEGRPIAIDVVTVWRIVEGRIAEVWDIPSVYAAVPNP